MRFPLSSAFFALLALVSVVLAAQPTDPAIILQDGGIQFPDGSLLMTADRSYSHVIVVAKEGGDFSSVNEALVSIAGGADAPSEGNGFLVWVAPGVYEEQVTMVPWVDVRGAGRELVEIRSTASPTIVGASHTHLSYLSVENTATAGSATALQNTQATFVRVSHADLKASGGATATGLWNDGSITHLHEVTIDVSGATTSYGVLGENSSILEMVGGRVSVTALSAGGTSTGFRNTGSSFSKVTHILLDSIAYQTAHCAHNSASTFSASDSRLSAASNGDFAEAAIFGVLLESGSGATIDRSTVSANAPTTGQGRAVQALGNSHFSANYSFLLVVNIDRHVLWLGDADSSGRVVYSRLDGMVGGEDVILDLHCYGDFTWDSVVGGFHGLDAGCQPIF